MIIVDREMDDATTLLVSYNYSEVARKHIYLIIDISGISVMD